jgi:hypothetical protein
MVTLYCEHTKQNYIKHHRAFTPFPSAPRNDWEAFFFRFYSAIPFRIHRVLQKRVLRLRVEMVLLLSLGLFPSLWLCGVELDESLECERIELPNLVDLQQREVVDLPSKVLSSVSRVGLNGACARTYLGVETVDGFDRSLPLSHFPQVLQKRPHSLRRRHVVRSSATDIDHHHNHHHHQPIQKKNTLPRRKHTKHKLTLLKSFSQSPCT